MHDAAAGADIAPFFRFPDLQHPSRILSYFAERNIAIFSTDIDSRDFALHRPEEVVRSVMSQLEKRGNGIVLLHDLHSNTAAAMPALLRELKAADFKIIHMVPKVQLSTIRQIYQMVSHNNDQSITRIIRTLSE